MGGCRAAVDGSSYLSSPVLKTLALVVVIGVSKGCSSGTLRGGGRASHSLRLSKSLELAACKGNEGGEVDGDVVLGKPLLILVEIGLEFAPVDSRP
jgi:hypothetical protein